MVHKEHEIMDHAKAEDPVLAIEKKEKEKFRKDVNINKQVEEGAKSHYGEFRRLHLSWR